MSLSEQQAPQFAGLAEKILDHWRQIIPAADVTDEPFQHMYIENIWPEDVYPLLLKMLPDVSKYEPINIKRWVRANGESTRDRIDLTDENIGSFGDATTEFWREIKRAFTSETAKRLIFDKLKKDLSLRLQVPVDQVLDQKVFIGGNLTRDTAEYRIKPHPDGYPRIVTMQFYMPESPAQIDLGTSLYEKEPLWRRLMGKKFREIKRFPFKSNSCYVIAVNELPDKMSYHGREFIEESSGVRNTLLIGWRAEVKNRDASSRLTLTPTNPDL